MDAFGLRPRGLLVGASRILNQGMIGAACVRPCGGLYAYETNHPPDSHLPTGKGVNPIKQPYYGLELVAVLPQEFEKL